MEQIVGPTLTVPCHGGIEYSAALHAHEGGEVGLGLLQAGFSNGVESVFG